jgi:hypothetical protein
MSLELAYQAFIVVAETQELAFFLIQGLAPLLKI